MVHAYGGVRGCTTQRQCAHVAAVYMQRAWRLPACLVSDDNCNSNIVSLYDTHWN
jgi:hypothetical protein